MKGEKVAHMAFVGGHVPENVAKAFDAIAAKNDRPRAAELRRAIREYVEVHGELEEPAA